MADSGECSKGRLHATQHMCGQEGVQLHAPLSSHDALLQGGFQSLGTNFSLVVSQPVPGSSCVQ